MAQENNNTINDPIAQAQQQVSAPQQQPPLSIEQILIKMVLDSQNNINRLVAAQERLGIIQEQQMIYINMMINQVNNESRQGKDPTTTDATTITANNPQISTGTIKTGATTEPSKPSNNKSVPKKH